MPIASAEQLRNRPILITVPGTDLQIQCRCPDPLDLIARGILPLETFHEVLERLLAWNELPNGPTANDITEAVQSAPKTYGEFVDRWVCAAAVAPEIVLTEEETAANPSRLWVDDIDVDVKFLIMQRTNRKLAPRVSAAVTEFRRQQSARAGAGPDGATIPDASVAAVAG